MNQRALRHAVSRIDDATSYEEILNVLVAAGVRLYHIDVASHTIYYSSDFDTYVDRRLPVIQEDGPAGGMFDRSAIRAALLALRRGEADYVSFLRRIWAAGVIEYEVNLLWRQITYQGREGETHVETIGLSRVPAALYAETAIAT